VNNDIAIGVGSGILLETRGQDASIVSSNRIAGTNGSVAIHVASPSKTGKQRIEQNTISGFAQGVIREKRNETLREQEHRKRSPRKA
jgi:hypothetical protein